MGGDAHTTVPTAQAGPACDARPRQDGGARTRMAHARAPKRRTMLFMCVTEATFQLLMSPLKLEALSNCDRHRTRRDAARETRHKGGDAHTTVPIVRTGPACDARPRRGGAPTRERRKQPVTGLLAHLT